MRDGRSRASIRIGAMVEIVRKEDQKTGKRTRGIVAAILTNSASHPHGIKVRLRDGKVGRVASVIGDDTEKQGE
ncbi:MAG TPA: YwbE family protein [Methanomicrobiales archaeon]|nr:YwbE family protein [Methanomicrobiales archaeon]